MQKTEKHCKNQCFCYHKTTKISPKTGPKTQKSASGPGHLRNRKKRCCKPKNWGQKVEKHGFFSLFACRFWTGAFTNRCLPYCFLQCFLKASVTTYQKQEVLAEKWDPPRGLDCSVLCDGCACEEIEQSIILMKHACISLSIIFINLSYMD